ncbi:monothiol glutaredoxin like protein [Zymoseptoria brevis]|uniref:Monothiol glutaredoxin like protein n=1 Tax=Zymoseptoria brevis TaxID=1047168 RepID=A0A0F4GGL1_9PEZI|nr:monothiol glutaredoxin like protein [Zymoseptoria brevis]
MAASNPSNLIPIESEAAFDSAISELPASCLAVICFHAPWAEPCRQMNTILSTLAATYESSTPPRIQFLSIDAEEVVEISERFEVSQVPFVVLQKDGRVVESITGTDAGKVRNAVEKHAGSGTGGSSLPPAQKVTPVQNQNQTTDVEMANGSAGAAAEAPAPSQEELNTRLGELVKAAPVMLFMKGTPSAPQCGFSRQTVSLLREKGVRYGFFNILADDEVRQGLKEYSDWPTFPQVYVGGELIGGLDIVKEEFENDPDFLKEYSVASVPVS